MFFPYAFLLIAGCGSETFQGIYGTTGMDEGSYGRQINDGAYVITGFTGSNNNSSQAFLMKLDVHGNIQNWNAGAERIKGYNAS